MIGDYFLHHEPVKGSSPKDVEIAGRGFIHVVGQEFFKGFADWFKGFVNDSCDRVAINIQKDYIKPWRIKWTRG